MTAEEPPLLPPIGELLCEPIITVKVGLQNKEYHIHKALLVHHSAFFRGALSSGTFKSAEDGVVLLEDVETGTFDAFAYWLYFRKLVEKEEWDKAYPHPNLAGDMRCGKGGWDSVTRLTWWFVFADRFIVPNFKKILMDFAFDVYAYKTPWYKDINYAWTNLPENSPFLRLMVDAHCKNWNREYDKKEDQSDIDELPGQFLYQAMHRMRECRNDERCSLRERSEYDESYKENRKRTRSLGEE